MKKSYINPSMLVVRLGMTQPLATSSLGLDGSKTLSSGEILVKEDNNVNDVNVWDDEW